MRNIDRAITGFLVLLFGFAGVDKLAHFTAFVSAINSYRILPIPLGPTLAPLVIAAELTIAVGLLTRGWRRAAAMQALLLMVVLTSALIGNRFLGDGSVCGCWFSVDMAAGNHHLLFNGIVILLSFSVWRTSKPASVRLQTRSLLA